jgi:hypothetical protein
MPTGKENAVVTDKIVNAGGEKGGNSRAFGQSDRSKPLLDSAFSIIDSGPSQRA